MLDAFSHKLKLAFGDSEIRFRIFFLAAALALFRLLSSIPIPGVDRAALASFIITLANKKAAVNTELGE